MVRKISHHLFILNQNSWDFKKKSWELILVKPAALQVWPQKEMPWQSRSRWLTELSRTEADVLCGDKSLIEGWERKSITPMQVCDCDVERRMSRSHFHLPPILRLLPTQKCHVTFSFLPPRGLLQTPRVTRFSKQKPGRPSSIGMSLN